jgi:chromosome segregation protein
LRLDTRSAATALDNVDLSTESGVMGRADRFVEASPEFVPLVKRLLSRTWLVDRLSTALRLSQTTGRGLEFVTSDGELLAADGTLVIGPRMAAAGIMSRRSELRACKEQVVDLEKQLSHYAANHGRLEQERAQQEALVASSVTAYSDMAGKLADCRQQAAISRGRLDRTTHERQQNEVELALSEQRILDIAAELESAGGRQADAEAAVEQLQTQLSAGGEKLAFLQQRHGELQSALTERQVAAAKCEQRVEMLRHQMELAQRNQQERDRALAEIRERLAARHAQVAELDETMLVDRQALAELFLCKERQIEEMAAHASTDQRYRGERARLTEQVRTERQQVTNIQSQQHKLEVAASRLRHERQTLCERMQDDYGIDLAEVARADAVAGVCDPGSPASERPATIADRSAVEREIAELRDQINNIGAVNLDALDELEQLESRFGTLSGQYRDLVDAKASLERIIQRINVDSRQLFLTTLETVRGHFQELFRRLFGGGEADIVVDEAEDVLESGIEIVARPPGKEACSISLLSGGEKTLTCVALLLAVFRSKPSPFCILDEVDAALDEANIGRFIGVLREFLSFTQFVVVTHSKKTMAGADTLYGVTMEESGVSKRVSVRFEDVSEDGQILPSGRPAADASDGSEQVRRAA